MGMISLEELNRENWPYCAVKFNLRFRGNAENDWYGFQPDVQVFPLYCTLCGKAQKGFFWHLGSRYGQVGRVTCQYCGAGINVTDHDNIVDSILINGREIFFCELYRTHWRYAGQIENRLPVSLKELFSDVQEITMQEATDRIARSAGVKITGEVQYVTDQRFKTLPPEVNRWIELLERCGAEGLYLKKR